MTVQPLTSDITQDDKLWAMLAFCPFIGFWVALYGLLAEDKKKRPFIKYHAVLAMALYVALAVSSLVVIGICVSSLIWIYQIYLMVQINKGEYVTIPVLTDFCKKQGWI
jgi:uncharacterized membrane protein